MTVLRASTEQSDALAQRQASANSHVVALSQGNNSGSMNDSIQHHYDDNDDDTNAAPRLRVGEDDADNESDEESRNSSDKWLESPFATGMTKRSWADERVGVRQLCRSCYRGDSNAGLQLTAFLCACTRVGRVGNMVVCKTIQRRQVQDQYTKELTDRPQLVCVMGPYWWIMLGVTFPALLFLAIWTGIREIPSRSRAVIVTWALCNATGLLALTQVACRDPGILYRYHEPPNDTWLWNDQAATWRPTHAKYDSDCAVVIEQFDHVCPWTGTAIGRSNMLAFRIFLVFSFASLLYNILLLSLF